MIIETRHAASPLRCLYPLHWISLHEPARIFSRGAANGEAIYFYRRNAYADRHCLAVLAAGAYAFVEFEIVAYHRDARQHIGAVANQRGAFNWRGDLAVLD